MLEGSSGDGAEVTCEGWIKRIAENDVAAFRVSALAVSDEDSLMANYQSEAQIANDIHDPVALNSLLQVCTLTAIRIVMPVFDSKKKYSYHLSLEVCVTESFLPPQVSILQTSMASKTCLLVPKNPEVKWVRLCRRN